MFLKHYNIKEELLKTIPIYAKTGGEAIRSSKLLDTNVPIHKLVSNTIDGARDMTSKTLI
jgi:hypothetical protein